MNLQNLDRRAARQRSISIGAFVLACLILASQCFVQASPSDPVFQGLMGLHHNLEFAGTIPYSANEGIQWAEFKDQRALSYDKIRTPGNVSLFLVPRHNKLGDPQQKIGHVELLEKLRASGVNARLRGDLVNSVLGGPFFVIEFSYDTFSGKIFNVSNPQIANDKDRSSRWYSESLAIAYDK